MSTATGLPPNVSIYLEALQAELADLAPEERDDLLSEVEPLAAGGGSGRGRADRRAARSAGRLRGRPARVAVENIYPYDRRGRLLHDVRLYDNFGRPLSILRGIDDPNRRPVFERGGARAFNAFPIRHFEPGTRRVARPNAGPGVAPAPLGTPPLKRR